LFPLFATTPAVPVAKFAPGVVDTGAKFATGGAHSLENVSANHKIRSNPNVIFRGLGKDVS
jgi:hypothetical protein